MKKEEKLAQAKRNTRRLFGRRTSKALRRWKRWHGIRKKLGAFDPNGSGGGHLRQWALDNVSLPELPKQAQSVVQPWQREAIEALKNPKVTKIGMLRPIRSKL